mmetsp:Transcript_43818/g.93172  ORF Transcript_43818/g.93172 Transcript_43818/m.93172 type:complete len:312 (-) Transcript_43818:119-1054(-)
MAPTITTPKSKRFSHRFSGVSVWLEPDPSRTSSLLREMDRLTRACGGSESGLHAFVPHCTLLYNTALPSCDDPRRSRDSNARRRRRQREGEDLLRRCLREYRARLNRRRGERPLSEPSSDEIRPDEMPRIKLAPTSHYYFRYPETADGGRGFGCCISLLILETNPELKALQEAAKVNFPPDERHGGAKDERATTSERRRADEGAAREEEAKFRPHMALVYAPEGHDNVTNGWLEERTSRMERRKRYARWISADESDADDDDAEEKKREEEDGPAGASEPAAWDARYLSVWSTEGTLDEWYPIAKIDLMPSR